MARSDVEGVYADTGGRLPENFVVTLAKVTIPSQVSALAGLLARLEEALGLPQESLKLEIMIETPQAIVNARGESNVLPLVEAGEISPRDVTLVIDRSGSMSGAPMDQACAAAELVVRRLRPRDRVNVIAFDRLQSDGFGSSRPIASNDSADGRARNRRVEMVIVRKEAVAGLPGSHE